MVDRTVKAELERYHGLRGDENGEIDVARQELGPYITL